MREMPVPPGCCVFRTLLVFRKHRSLDTDNQVIADDEGRGRGGIEFTYEFQLSDINPSRCTDVQRGRKREGMETRDEWVGAFYSEILNDLCLIPQRV